MIYSISFYFKGLNPFDNLVSYNIRKKSKVTCWLSDVTDQIDSLISVVKSKLNISQSKMAEEEESSTSTPRSFAGQTVSAEEMLKEQTVGLVHLSDFRKRRADVLEAKEREAHDKSLGLLASGNSRIFTHPSVISPAEGVALLDFYSRSFELIAAQQVNAFPG